MSSPVPGGSHAEKKADGNNPDLKFKQAWSIVLAGGNGSRIVELTRRWMGRPVPKQYCAFVGTRSMLEHTLQRADRWSGREHQLIVIAADHQREAERLLADRWPRGVVVQPANRDTLPGIYLPLTHIYARDSKATVLIFPSDHFIYPEKSFEPLVARAVRAVEELPNKMILFAAPADSPEPEYGWVYPGDTIWKSEGSSIQAVRQFLEKPSAPLASQAMARGGMWNTLIMAAKVETLWQLGWNYSPEVMKHFERLAEAIGTSREQGVLESVYEIMPSRNFSSDLLAQAEDQIGVISMQGVTWSDWGRQERIVQTLARIGKAPNFSMVPAELKRAVEPTDNRESRNTILSLPVAS